MGGDVARRAGLRAARRRRGRAPRGGRPGVRAHPRPRRARRCSAPPPARARAPPPASPAPIEKPPAPSSAPTGTRRRSRPCRGGLPRAGAPASRPARAPWAGGQATATPRSSRARSEPGPYQRRPAAPPADRRAAASRSARGQARWPSNPGGSTGVWSLEPPRHAGLFQPPLPQRGRPTVVRSPRRGYKTMPG